MTVAAPPPATARSASRSTTSRRRAWHGDAVTTLTLLSLAVVTALWMANRGLQELVAGPGPGLTSAGRVDRAVARRTCCCCRCC